MDTTLHCGDTMKDYTWSSIESAAREPQPEHRTRRIAFDPNHWEGRVNVPVEDMRRIAEAFAVLDHRCTFSTQDGFVAELTLPNADYDRWSKNIHDGVLVMAAVFVALTPGWASRTSAGYRIVQVKEALVEAWEADGLDGKHLVYEEPF